MLTIDDIVKERGITQEELDQAERDTEEYIRAYELRQARKAARLTQKQLASKMKVSQKRISELEHGKISSMKLDTLRRYVEGIGGKLDVRVILPNEEIHLA